MAKKKAAKKKAVKKAAAKKPSPPAVKKGPRQAALPGMEDRAIESLNDAALSYDEAKKDRMAKSKVEKEKKTAVQDLMHAMKKKHYQYSNVIIDLVPEGEKVKVKILPEGTEPSEEDLEKNREGMDEEPNPPEDEPEPPEDEGYAEDEPEEPEE